MVMRYLLTLCLLLAIPACADDTPAEKGTVVSLSGTADAVLENDEVVVTYRIEATGRNAATLQGEVNAVALKVKAVLDRQGGDLKRQTIGRNLQAVSHYDKTNGRQVRDGWQLVQREQVTSRNLDAVAGWVDAIEQAGAHLDRLAFGLSDQARSKALDTLRMQAVQLFRARAMEIAKALDASSFRILTLHSDPHRPPAPVLQHRALAMTATEATPALHAGESRLSATLSGDILLPDRRFTLK